METAAVGCSLEHNYKFSEEMGRSFVLILHMHIVYWNLYRKLHPTEQCQFLRECFSKLNTFTYCARIIAVTFCIDIMRIF